MPIVFGAAIVSAAPSLPVRLLNRCATGTLVYGAAASAVAGTVVVGMVRRSMPFTGGPEGAHPSAYLVAVCILLLHQGFLSGQLSRRQWFLSAGLGCGLLFSLHVATPVMMLLVYFLVRKMLRPKGPGKKPFISLSLTIVLASTVGGLVIATRLSDGRLANSSAESRRDLVEWPAHHMGSELRSLRVVRLIRSFLEAALVQTPSRGVLGGGRRRTPTMICFACLSRPVYLAPFLSD